MIKKLLVWATLPIMLTFLYMLIDVVSGFGSAVSALLIFVFAFIPYIVWFTARIT